MADQLKDKTELAELYSRHRQGLFTLALAITRSRQSAEDAIHDVFARLCRRELIADDPAAYIFAAVRNAARDLATKRKTGELVLDLIDSSAPPDASAQAAELSGIVHKCLEELDEPHREVVVMKLWTGLTFDQIAGITGEPLQTVASRYRRALLKLKDLMGTRV